MFPPPRNPENGDPAPTVAGTLTRLLVSIPENRTDTDTRWLPLMWTESRWFTPEHKGDTALSPTTLTVVMETLPSSEAVT